MIGTKLVTESSWFPLLTRSRAGLPFQQQSLGWATLNCIYAADCDWLGGENARLVLSLGRQRRRWHRQWRVSYLWSLPCCKWCRESKRVLCHHQHQSSQQHGGVVDNDHETRWWNSVHVVSNVTGAHYHWWNMILEDFNALTDQTQLQSLASCPRRIAF